MKTRSHRPRRRGGDMPPVGYLQPCLPMPPAPAPVQVPMSVTTPIPEGPEPHPVSLIQTWTGLAEAFTAAFTDLAALRERYSTLHSHKAMRLLTHAREIVSGQIGDLDDHSDQPGLPYRLRSLYRLIGEAMVLVKGIGGLAETGRLLTEPSGMYWQGGQALLTLQRACQDVAALCQKQGQASHVHPCSTRPALSA